MHFYVALRRGDAISLRGVGLPWKTLAAFEQHDGGAPFDQADRGSRIGKPAWIGGDREATFRPPHDGWFKLWIAALEEGKELTPYRLCAQLKRYALVGGHRGWLVCRLSISPPRRSRRHRGEYIISK